MLSDTARVNNIVEANQLEIIRFLRELVAIPSLSTQEEDVVKQIAEEMRTSNYDEVKIDGIGNVIGRVGNGKHKIMMIAHVDTVGIADPEAWKYDPYLGKQSDQVVYGRGASDDKACIACMVKAGALIKELDLLNNFTLYVVGSVEEENCDGWAVYEMITKEGIVPDYVVIGEATSLDVYRGQRGRCEIKVTVKGKSCHASNPDLGENSIYQLVPIIQGIQDLQNNLKDDPFLGKGTIAITKIECATGSLNVVPDKASIYIDRRMTVGETAESSLEEIKNLPGAENASVELLNYDEPSYTGYQKHVVKDFPTWMLSEDHPLVNIGVKTLEQILNKTPKVNLWAFSTDGVATMGRLKIPTIGFGPGEEKHAHTVDEQVPISDLLVATKFYTLFPYLLTEFLDQ